MGVQTRTSVELAGHRPSTRLSEKLYLKVTRQTAVEQGTWISGQERITEIEFLLETSERLLACRVRVLCFPF